MLKNADRRGWLIVTELQQRLEVPLEHVIPNISNGKAIHQNHAQIATISSITVM